MKFDKYSKEYMSNGVYNISGITFITLWAWKKSTTRFSEPNTSIVNKAQSLELSRLGYPSIETKPDVSSFETVKAFPLESIEYYFHHHVGQS